MSTFPPADANDDGIVLDASFAPEESERVEAIVSGWWKGSGGSFARCRTMELGLHEGVIVLDAPTEAGQEFELHLDVEAEWSVRLKATSVTSRPIFFGQQHLTKVLFRFVRGTDETMFSLWLQKQRAERNAGRKDYLKPAARRPARQGEEPVLGPARRLAYLEARWRRALSRLKSRIPWREAPPVPNDRRSEHRGQVGLAVTLLSQRGRLEAELLNVSWSGACIFLESAAVAGGKWPGVGDEAELVISESSLLIGSRRCPVTLMWCQEAQALDGEPAQGRAYGLRFTRRGPELKRTFMGDLLRRLRYDPRQVRKELRFPLQLPVTVSALGQTLSGHTLDLSAGGARLALPSSVTTPCDGFVELTLTEGSGRPQKVRLSVRFLREVPLSEPGFGYAVAFRKAQPEAHLKLSRWLATRMRVQTLGDLEPVLAMGDRSSE